MKFTNPVIPGFHPDPSICRRGKDYYLVTSSFEYFPGVPVYHSRDLINWRHAGYCLTRKSQLSLRKVTSLGGIYAPTIRFHGGMFFMTTTNVTGRGNFYVYARDPLKEWSEPIWVKQGGIDPSLFFDDDGKVYFASTGDNCIVQSRIDIKTGELLTKTKKIWGGTGGSYPEGPRLYKINGVYYLMIAEGGTEYGHMETIARSNSPWGPFESCIRNPILTHRSTSLPIQATGHADLIQVYDGSWWLVFLGIRPTGHPYCHHLGRETFLAPVKWDKNGWPIVGRNGKVSLEMEADCLPMCPWRKESVRDDFKNEKLSLKWNFIGNPVGKSRSLTKRPGWLALFGSKAGLDNAALPVFIGRRQEHFDCKASTLLDFIPRHDKEEAGLTARMNEHHHYEIAVTRLESKRCVIVRRRIGDLSAIVALDRIGIGAVKLEITADRNKYYFSYALPNRKPKVMAKAETRYLSTEIAGGWTGVYFGMYASGNGRKCITAAYFDWFDYAGRD